MYVYVVIRFIDDDIGGGFSDVYGVFSNEELAREAVKQAPKATSIVDGYTYTTIKARVMK